MLGAGAGELEPHPANATIDPSATKRGQGCDISVVGQFEIRPRLFGDVVFVFDTRGTQAGGFAVGDLLGEPMGFFDIIEPYSNKLTISSIDQT